MSKELLGALSALSVIVVAGPYIWSIMAGRTKPHLFTWLVWGLSYSIIAAAQYSAGAGPGMWTTVVGCLFELVIAALAFWRGERNITISDWLSFLGALAAIPLWYATKNPVWSVILLMAIDALGFYPTFRKSWTKPHDELAYMYIADAVRYGMGILATDHYSLTTILTPAQVIVSNGAFVCLLFWRRYRLRNDPAVKK